MKTTTIRTLAAATALASLSLAAGAAQAQTATLYWDSNFQGRSHTVSGPTANLAASGFNDQASSLRLQGDWELCENANFGGRCEVLGDRVANLSDWSLNDRISSLRPALTTPGRPDRPGRPGRPDRPGGGWGGGNDRASAIAYRDANFLGAETRLDGEQQNLAATGFNDQISSLRLRGRWEVCADARFGGSCQILEGDIRNLSDYGLNDRVSSMRPVQDYGGGWQPGRPGGGWGGGNRGPRITVYRDANYLGTATELRGEQPNLAAQGLNDQISSMRLEGRWEACTDADFRGRCETFEGNVGNLASQLMNDQVSSLRPVRGGWGW